MPHCFCIAALVSPTSLSHGHGPPRFPCAGADWAAALLHELRSGDSGTTQRREWVLRASAADLLLGSVTIIAQAG